ncbi:MAG: hypothetical protein ACI81T_002862 [Bacteroidia bacterium]|jgi:hypothetical protein
MKSISNFFLKVARFFNPDLAMNHPLFGDAKLDTYQEEGQRFWESEFIRSESLHHPRISSIEGGIVHLFARLKLDYDKSNNLEDGFIKKEKNGDLILRDDNGNPLFTITKEFLDNHQEGFCDTFMFAHDGYWRKHYT